MDPQSKQMQENDLKMKEIIPERAQNAENHTKMVQNHFKFKEKKTNKMSKNNSK